MLSEEKEPRGRVQHRASGGVAAAVRVAAGDGRREGTRCCGAAPG